MHGLFNMTSLTKLWLFGNSLVGTLAPLAKLTRLIDLGLSLNRLEGNLSPLQSMTLLTALNLGKNSFSGALPSLDTNTRLRGLYLFENKFSGELPNSWAALKNLDHLSLSDNGQLRGPLNVLGNMTRLVYCALGNNKFSGDISVLSNLTMLTDQLIIEANQLWGSLTAFKDFTALTILYAGNNQLTGSLEPISLLTNLMELSLAMNDLSGPLDPLAGMTSLQVLDLFSNRLSGTLDPIAQATQLDRLRMQHNQLQGTLNPLVNMTKVRWLLLQNNAIVGSLAPLSGMSALLELDVTGNQIAGDLFPLSDLTAVTSLSVSSNQLTGDLSPLSRLTALSSLLASFNALGGSLSHLLTLTSLSIVDLSVNRLMGNLSFLNFTAIVQLNLSSNLLTSLCSAGTAPTLQYATKLKVLDLSANDFSDQLTSLWNCLPLPSVKRLLLGSNKLRSTTFQIDLQLFTNATLIDMSQNALSGKFVLNGLGKNSDSILNLLGNSFDCPMPFIPPGKNVMASPCTASFLNLLIYLGYLAVVAAVIGGLFFINKWHQKMRFVQTWAIVTWLISCFGLINDLRLLFSMVTVVLAEASNCSILNNRHVFLPFMTILDEWNGFISNRDNPTCPRPVYFNPEGPFGVLDPRTTHVIR